MTSTRQAGFGLIETLIALGIMTIIGLGTATLLVDSAASQKHIENKYEIISKFREVEELLSSKDLCMESMISESGQPISSQELATFKVPLQQIVYPSKSGPSRVVFEANSVDGSIRIDDLTLEGVSKLGGQVRVKHPVTGADVIADKYLMSIMVDSGRAEGALVRGPTSYKVKEFNFIGLFDSAGSNELLSCYEKQSDAYFCETVLDGDYDESQIPHCKLNTMGIGNRVSPATSPYYPMVIVGEEGAPERELMYISKNSTGVALGLGVKNPVNRLTVNGFSVFDGNVTVTKNLNSKQMIEAKSLRVIEKAYFKDVDLKYLKVNGYTEMVGNVTVGKNFYVGKQLSAQSVVQRSDKRLKKDFAEIDKAQLEKLSEVRPISYKFKNDQSEKTQYGVIAQDLQKIYPELVVTGKDKMLAVDYQSLTILMLKELQSLKQELKELKAANKPEEK